MSTPLFSQRRFQKDMEAWRTNVARFPLLNFKKPQKKDYLQESRRVCSLTRSRSPFDFRLDFAARKSLGFAMLPAYVNAKEIGELAEFLHDATYLWLFTFPEDCLPGRKSLDQQSYRLGCIIYGAGYEEEPDEDIKRFLWQALPDDAERLHRRDTLADLTLSGYFSEAKCRIKTCINEQGPNQALHNRTLLQQALHAFLERAVAHRTVVVAQIQSPSWSEELTFAVHSWTRLNRLPFEFLTVHAPFPPYVPFLVPPEMEPCSELRPWSDGLAWVYPEEA